MEEKDGDDSEVEAGVVGLVPEGHTNFRNLGVLDPKFWNLSFDRDLKFRTH